MIELTAEAHHQTAVVKPQVRQTLSVISTNVLVLQPTMSPSLQFSGKGQSRREEEKLNSLPVSGYLVYLQDALSNRAYLVDTGASRSVFPHCSPAALTGPHLLMADGRPTKAWGSRLIPLQFGSHHFLFQFPLADVYQPILGADFLAEFDLLVDTKNRQVLQNLSFEPLGFLPPIPPLPLCVKSDVASLLDEFPAAWNPRIPGKLPEHNIEHVIETEGQPLYAGPAIWIKLS